MLSQTQITAFKHYLPRYGELDPSEAAQRTGLVFNADTGQFTLELLGHTVYAAWPELELIPSDPDRCPKVLYGFQMQVLTMRYLLEAVHAPASGAFKAYRELPWGELYDANFTGRCIKRFAYGFGYKPEVFAKAADVLGGVRLDMKDIAYDLPFLGGITCKLILWLPDEEFPPSAQFLFSDNTQFAFNAEDLAVVGDVIISALKESAR